MIRRQSTLVGASGMSDLSSRQISQLKAEFLALDENGDGTISKDELAKILREVKSKLNMTEKDIQRILYDFDQDGSGTIEVNEFLVAMANKKDRDFIIKAFTNRSSIRKQFVKFDKDKNGWIDKKEFKKCLETTTKTKLTKEQIDTIMKRTDQNGDGKIDYDEFIKAMTV